MLTTESQRNKAARKNGVLALLDKAVGELADSKLGKVRILMGAQLVAEIPQTGRAIMDDRGYVS